MADETANRMEVMTPDHPRWEDFCDRVMQRIKEHGCDNTSQSHSSQVMLEMGGIDIQVSLEFFSHHGGQCDCMVLANVEDAFEMYKLADPLINAIFKVMNRHADRWFRTSDLVPLLASEAIPQSSCTEAAVYAAVLRLQQQGRVEGRINPPGWEHRVVISTVTGVH